MKRAAAILAALLIVAAPLCVAAQGIATDAAASVLIEMTSLRVLSGENIAEKLPMASTTKVMTALLAVEHGDLDETITVSESAQGVEGSSIWLSAGETLTLRELLLGLMLSSGNDASVAIAEHVGGSVEAFADMMNVRAGELGATNTHFVNPNGLPADDHYTTAYDLAIITAEAMKLPEFREIVSTQYATIPWDAGDYDRTLKNKNKLLWQYDGANGVKTGFTKEAGHCLVAAAERNGMQLICVVLRDGDKWSDCMELLNYGFDNYTMVTAMECGELIGQAAVANGVEDSVTVRSQENFSYPMSADEAGSFIKKTALFELAAPVTADAPAGGVEIYLNDELIYSKQIVAGVEIPADTYYYNLSRILRRWL